MSTSHSTEPHPAVQGDIFRQTFAPALEGTAVGRIQGHLFSEPVPAWACEGFLARHRT